MDRDFEYINVIKRFHLEIVNSKTAARKMFKILCRPAEYRRKVILDELNSLIKHENNSRVLKRLYFVKFRYLGDSVEEAATKVGVTKKCGYYWQDDWNKGGYAALIPNFGEGRKRKLTDE